MDNITQLSPTKLLVLRSSDSSHTETYTVNAVKGRFPGRKIEAPAEKGLG